MDGEFLHREIVLCEHCQSYHALQSLGNLARIDMIFLCQYTESEDRQCYAVAKARTRIELVDYITSSVAVRLLVRC